MVTSVVVPPFSLVGARPFHEKYNDNHGDYHDSFVIREHTGRRRIPSVAIPHGGSSGLS